MLADNPAGTLAAACSVWHFAPADSMSARAIVSPLQMPDIRLQARSSRQFLSIKLLRVGRSPYTAG